MRDFLKRRVRWPSVGWLWVVALLALPDCGFSAGSTTFRPRTTAVFCDIEKPLFGRHCASDAEKARGIRLAAGAVALTTGATTDVALDESPASLAACGGQPEAVLFYGAFPEGQAACVNGIDVGPGATYADPDAFCVVTCENLLHSTTDPSVIAFCTARAHASINVPTNPNPGFIGRCQPEGTLRPDFVDPRQTADAVVWTDLRGVVASGGTLTRNAATTPPLNNPPFDAGAASTQWIARGDAYAEFSAPDTTLTHVMGLSQIPGGCAFPCPDTDPSLTDINFAISLNRDGRLYVVEGGALIPGPDINGSFGTYAAGERFRVSVKQSSDGSSTATITYSRLIGSCMPGMPCPETAFFTHAGVASYPLRVDASFRELNETLTDVRLVRIQ
jgi:hypothetical protein